MNQRADMLLEVDGRILRIQCKTARLRNGTVRFSTRSVRANRTGIFFRSYVGEIDFFAVYCPANRRVFMVPCEEGLSVEPTLRLAPTINNQSMRIQWAEDYALEHWSP